MNKREKRKILRKFCSSSGYKSFITEEQGYKYIEKIKQSFELNEIFLELIHCTICGEWHLLQQYKPFIQDAFQYPNKAEREIILNEPFVEKDFTRKRTKAKMLGRYRNTQKFPKPKSRFGTVPDNGWFDRIISSRYVCFSCRKSWRKFFNRREQMEIPYTERFKAMTNCPHCGSLLQQVYPMFRAPKRNDIKAWKKLEKKYTNE